jgi:hypothetical protein
MTALQKLDEAEIIPQDAGLLAIISRAASDPNVDIDKLERLLAAQERVQANQAKMHYIAAKLALRPELPEITMKGHIIIKKDGRVTQDTPFARFEDIHEAVMPILDKHGFDLSFRNSMAPDGKVRVATVLTHVQGHSEETYFDLPHDSSGSKNAVQAIGSSTSYAKRYGVLSILNIRVSGEDDDAATAVTPKMEANERINNPVPYEKKSRAEKWEGPYSGISALRAGMTVIDRNIRGCGDSEELAGYLQTPEYKQFVATCERYHPLYLTGGPPAPPEFVGINDLVAKMRADFELIENNVLRGG